MADIISKIYSTSQIAKLIGIHSNTVRLYEHLNLIPKPSRKSNGYRVFTDLHVAQFRLARTAFQIEVVHNKLRKTIINIVKLSAEEKYDEAISLTKSYIYKVDEEISNAKEAVDITKKLLKKSDINNNVSLKRKAVSNLLGITMDTLRNWEMNGLLCIKRSEKGYRIYNAQDIQRLRIIKSLRCANYSLSAILRMLNTLSNHPDADIHHLLNSPSSNEDIVSVCDQLIVSLIKAKKNAEMMIHLLDEMRKKYYNPPL